MGSDQLQRRVERFDLASQREALRSPEVVQNSRATRHPLGTGPGEKGVVTTIRLFQVTSKGAADGLYYCFEQFLDQWYWQDTTGFDKLQNITSYDDWDAETNYEINDTVEHENRVYQCVQDHEGQEPPHEEYWQIISHIICNLHEYGYRISYGMPLEYGDRILAWPVKDDILKTRWVGIPFDHKPPKVYQVLAAGTGYGIYTCWHPSFDATDWVDVTGNDKCNTYTVWQETNYSPGDMVFNDDVVYMCIKAHDNREPPSAGYWTSITVNVLNLAESDPVGGYQRALAKGDRLKCFLLRDDESNLRIVGTPLEPGPRRARTTAGAGSGSLITCNLMGRDGSEITTGLGAGISVNCDIFGGEDLNEAIPRITTGKYTFVQNVQGNWHWIGGFQASEDCACSAPP